MYKHIWIILLAFVASACSGGGGSDGGAGCDSLDCRTDKYNLLVAEVDFNDANPQGTNIQVIATSSSQDMTHARVSPDKNWVAYTVYNDTNMDGCASTDSGYVNTEIKATRIDGSETKSIIPVTTGELSSNNYWYGSNSEFTFLNGPPGGTKIYRAQTDANMDLLGAPVEVTTPMTIIPLDPHADSNTQLVYPGLYDNMGIVKSIFHQSLNPPDAPVGLSLARDSMGNILYGDDAMENDPKLSPDGTQVAFMRRAPNAGVNGFGWRIFVVPVAVPLSEVNISASLGDTQLNHDTLPEWVDNDTLVISNIEIIGVEFNRTLWAMERNGTNRRQVTMPAGYHYADVYPFIDGMGRQKIIVSAEKISANCTP